VGRILIIDDDELFCFALSGIVAKEGHGAECAHSLADGLERAKAHDFDLVFLDVRLPDGNGIALLSRLKDLPTAPEIIIITGAGDPDGAETAIKNGAWDYIEKTDTPQKLALSFLRALEYRKRKLATRPPPPHGIKGKSRKMRNCVDQMVRAARSTASVLILGETGTGKEVFARALHEHSPRAGRPFVVVDCASHHEGIMDSELFGHKRGAFTGADRDKAGRVLKAHGGTLFLDEVSELAPEVQKSFLRVLESRRFVPLGGDRELESDFRLVSASNRDLDELARLGRFRSDLLYRIRAVTIHLPPLRERSEDLPELAEHGLAELCRRNLLPQKTIAPDLLEILLSYDWPGNVRELFRVLDALVAEAPGEDVYHPAHLPRDLFARLIRFRVAGGRSGAIEPPLPPEHRLKAWAEFRREGLEALERRYLEGVVAECRGDVRQAMQVSGLSQARLYGLLRKHGLSLSRG
jgi:two-component system NtrC family response regulator